MDASIVLGPFQGLEIGGDLLFGLQATDVALGLIVGKRHVLLEGKGKLDLQTTSGDIETSGRLQAETSLNSASGDLQGDLSIAPSAAVSLISNSGDIDLIVRPDSQCKLDVASRSGDVECRLSLDGQEVNEHFLQGRLGSGEGTLTARTNSGDVLIS